MAALFWARGAERYVRQGGTIAFVLPYAVLNRPAFGGLRRGNFGSVQVHITKAWNLAQVRPIFGRTPIGTTSVAVLFGCREPAGALPGQVERFVGTLPRRDASETEADAALQRSFEPWPAATTLEGLSPYLGRFSNDATVYPRRFFSGRTGTRRPARRESCRAARPRQGRGPRQEAVAGGRAAARTGRGGPSSTAARREHRAVSPPHVGAERCANRQGAVLDAPTAANAGFRHLAAWLRDVESKWVMHSSKRADGAPRMSLKQQRDHVRKLSGQLSPARVRVAYTKAGTLLSAAVLDAQRVVIDHKAYWAAARSIDEARYLTAILNTGLVLRRIIPMQPRGWRGPATSTTSSGNGPFPNTTAERPYTESLPRPLRRPKPSPHRSH